MGCRRTTIGDLFLSPPGGRFHRDHEDASGQMRGNLGQEQGHTACATGFTPMKLPVPAAVVILLLAFVQPTHPQDWQFECMNSTLGPSHYRRLILDQQNLPHIFFYNSDNRHLMQFYKSDTGWNLVDYGILFVPEGLDIDTGGNFHLCQGSENDGY